jgi:hypothetical protein
MSASDSFHALLTKITPTENQRQRVITHRDTISTRLQSQFNLYDLLTIGSFKRGTDIAGESDVDLFAVFRREEVVWGDSVIASTTMLDKVRKALEDRYPNTQIYRDVHAIVARFSSGVQVDIVPAYFAGMTLDKHPTYGMPDGTGRWMKVSPSAHRAYIDAADTRAGGKLRGTARLMKYWRSRRPTGVSLSSFHIEMVLAQENICAGIKTYAQCFTELLMKLAERNCSALRDPLSIAGNIPAVKAPSLHQKTVDSIAASRDRAKEAQAQDVWGSTAEARRLWNIVFDGGF